MAMNAALSERLDAAQYRWTTVRGVTRWWRRQSLVDIAFHRDSEGLSAEGAAVVSASFRAEDGEQYGGDRDLIVEVLAVAAASQGRRRRAETLSRTGEEWMPDLVVVDEPWFWVRKGHLVQTNDGDPSWCHGGADFVELLRPGRVSAGFALAATGETATVASRDCDVVRARPVEPHEFGEVPGAEVFGMISGGQEFQLFVDRQSGILMRVVKFVDGAPAEVREFVEITFDEPLDEALFHPLR